MQPLLCTSAAARWRTLLTAWGPLALLLLWLPHAGQAQIPAAPTAPSVGQVLNPDGTLRAGTRGSFSTQGYRLGRNPRTGAPVFRTTGVGDENWQDGFGARGMNNVAQALAVDGNGNLYVGSALIEADGITANNIAKWDGTRWSVLGSGTNNPVAALAVDGGGNVYAGGNFTQAGGVAANSIAKWNGTGWSALGTGMNGGVNALLVDGSGNVYAGGYFTQAGGITVNNVAKWNGTTWGALSTGVNNGVQTLAADNVGNIYAGGIFTTAGGLAASYVAKWNGISWSSLGSGVNGAVNTLVVDSGGNLYAGGGFTTAGGMAANRLAKWNGTTWSALGAGLNGPVYKLAVDGSNNVYVGGSFTTAGGATANYIAKWNGASWSTLSTGTDEYVGALTVAGSGSLYAGGAFTTAGGMVVNHIAKWDGTNWSALGTGVGLNTNSFAVAVDGSGSVYVGGDFVTAGNLVVNHVAKWNGTTWSALGSGTNGSVSALAVDGNGNVYAGGYFTQAGGITANNVAKWNGTTWSALGAGTGHDTRALALDGAGNLYAGGFFNTAGGVTANLIAKWNGVNWSNLGTGLGGVAVYALAADGSGNLYAGGNFTTAGSVAVSYIAKWNGTAWSAPDGVDNTVLALKLDGSGNLYAGGQFNHAGSVAAHRIAKWDGTSWSALGVGMDAQVAALALDGSGNLYAGGSFTTSGGTAATYVAKWNGANWTALGTGANNSVQAMAARGNSLYAGGYFTNVGDGSKSMSHFGIYRALAAPMLSSLSPASGAAGSTITLNGTDLTGTSTITFAGSSGNTVTTGFAVNAAGTQITGVVVPGGATTGSLTVTTPGGTSNGLTFTVTAPLAVTAVSPVANLRNAGRTSPVQVTFNQPLTAGSDASLKVFSAQRGGLRSRGATPALVSGATLTYTATQPFMPGETVSSTVTTAATGSNGGNLVTPKVVQFTAAAGIGPGTFGGGSDPAVGNGAASVAVGDVDGDGDLDLLTANFRDNTVSIRLNNGSGVFSGGSDPSVGNAPASVTVGDVDSDGDLDLLTANRNGGTVSVRLNNGSGIFSGGSDCSVGNDPRSVAVGDVDGDGDLDLLAANYGTNTVSVRLNNGSGVFSGGSNPSVGNAPASVAVGDVDRDGDLDLLAANNSGGTVSVRLNNGSGVFNDGSDVATGGNPLSIALGDVDSDGDLDLLQVNGYGSTVSIWLNNGSGVFSSGSSPGVGGNPFSVAVGDVDGDGDLDLLTASYDFRDAVSVRLNNGSGVFGGGSDVAANNPFSVAVGDVDGDGDLDLLTANIDGSSANGNTVSVRLNQVLPDLVISTPGQSIAAGTYNSLLVTSMGVGTLAGNVTVTSAVTVQAGGVLNDGCFALSGTADFTLAPGATLGVCSPQGLSATAGQGPLRNTGSRSLSIDASYVYNGTSAQVTGGQLPYQVRSLTTTNNNALTLTSPVAVGQVLTVGAAGNLTTNGNALTLLSSASGTALVVNSGSGVVSGNVTVQRYIDQSLNSGLGYRHLAAPVQGATVAAFGSGGTTPVVNSAYNSSATPSTTAPFPTVFGYNQNLLATASNNLTAFDKGWHSPTNLSDQLSTVTGYTVQVAGGQTLTFTGPVTSLPSNTTVNWNRGSDPNAGWALLGNPFPSPLDFSSIPASAFVVSGFSSVDRALYVFQSTGRYTGQYRAWVNGVGGGNPLIGMGQAFFVRVSNGYTLGALGYSNANRVTTYGQQAPVRRTTTDPRSLVALELRPAAGPADVLYAYAETGATPAFDSQYDAQKIPNSTGLNLSSTATSGEHLSIDGRGAWGEATALPLNVGVPAAGTYTLAATQLDNLPAGLTAYLYDAQTGQSLPLVVGTTYSFSVTATQAQTLFIGRFALRFGTTAPLAGLPAVLAAQVLLYPNPAHEQLTVAVPGVAGTSAVQAELLNSLGQVVLRQQALLPATGTHLAVATGHLAPGVYVLRLTAGDISIVRRVVLE